MRGPAVKPLIFESILYMNLGDELGATSPVTPNQLTSLVSV